MCAPPSEAATNDVTDYRVGKAIAHLPELRQKMQAITDRYQDVQQDILETFVDRGQLRQLSQPTVLTNGKRIPGLKLDHPRQLAVMHALVRFAHIAASGTFSTPEIYSPVREALGLAPSEYQLSSLRDDLWKLGAKGLVEKVPHSHRYRLPTVGYRLCVVYLKLFEKIYAPLTAGLLAPFGGDRALPPERIAQLDRLYQRVVTALDQLVEAVGLKVA